MSALNFRSDARQDQFASIVIGDKIGGFYIDIGSHHSERSNNTYYFSKLGWRGICIEIDRTHEPSYSSRSGCNLIIGDATKVSYKEMLEASSAPLSLDYMSLDVDIASLEVLRIFPFDSFRPKIITIEHDAYIYGDEYRAPQRKILEQSGYMLLASNVFVEQSGYEDKECPFEDWWVEKEFLGNSAFRNTRFESKLPSSILECLKNLHNGKDKITIC